MSSLFGVALCLITVFSLVSCAASTARTVAQEQESEVKRAPDFRNKEVNRQYVRNKY